MIVQNNCQAFFKAIPNLKAIRSMIAGNSGLSDISFSMC